MSFKLENNSSVYVLDSLKSNKTLNSNIQLQLSQMYSGGKNSLNIIVPDVQRQNNSSDCGVFAIAFLTEFLYCGFEFNYNQCRFEPTLMRRHLLKCLEERIFSPFPKVKKMPKMPVSEPKINKIKLYCTCNLPEMIDDMILCGSNTCKIKWFHKSCVNYENEIEWKCSNCL